VPTNDISTLIHFHHPPTTCAFGHGPTPAKSKSLVTSWFIITLHRLKLPYGLYVKLTKSQYTKIRNASDTTTIKKQKRKHTGLIRKRNGNGSRLNLRNRRARKPRSSNSGGKIQDTMDKLVLVSISTLNHDPT
jgi:hypothetical protein